MVQNSEGTKEYTVKFPSPAAPFPLQRLPLTSVSRVFLIFFTILKSSRALLKELLCRVAWIWFYDNLFNQAPFDGGIFGCFQSFAVIAIASINGECGLFLTCKAIWRMSSQKQRSSVRVCVANERSCQLGKFSPHRGGSSRCYSHQCVRAFHVVPKLSDFWRYDTWKMVSW